MKQPDYTVRPSYNDRKHPDYGFNRITSDTEPRSDRFWWWLVIAVAIGIVMQCVR